MLEADGFYISANSEMNKPLNINMATLIQSYAELKNIYK